MADYSPDAAEIKSWQRTNERTGSGGTKIEPAIAEDAAKVQPVSWGKQELSRQAEAARQAEELLKEYRRVTSQLERLWKTGAKQACQGLARALDELEMHGMESTSEYKLVEKAYKSLQDFHYGEDKLDGDIHRR